MSNIKELCIGRIWNKGQGARCSRKCKEPFGEFCGVHGKLVKNTKPCPDKNCFSYQKTHLFTWEHLGRYDERTPKFFSNKSCYEIKNIPESNIPESNIPESNKIESNKIESNKIESNKIESNKSNKFNKINNIVRILDIDNNSWLYDIETKECFKTTDLNLRISKGIFNKKSGRVIANNIID